MRIINLSFHQLSLFVWAVLNRSVIIIILPVLAVR